jgi:hypothetical protein
MPGVTADRLSCQQACQLFVGDGTANFIDLTRECQRAGLQTREHLVFRLHLVKLGYSFIDCRKPKIKPFDFSVMIGFGILPNRLSPHDRPPVLVTPA